MASTQGPVSLIADSESGELAPDRKILAEQFEGVPLVFPDDLDRQGWDLHRGHGNGTISSSAAGANQAHDYYIRPEDELVKASDEAASRTSPKSG